MFSKFENFGYIADKNKRKALAKAIFDNMQQTLESEVALSDAETDNFSTAINDILANKTMRELCQKDPELAEKITDDILEFINKTKKHITANDTFSSEYKLLELFSAITKDKFGQAFKDNTTILQPFFNELKKKYKDIDTDFYQKELALSLADNNQRFESVKEHLMDKWKGLLFKKETAYQLNIIDEKRQLFCEELYQRIAELKTLQEGLAPFTKELGRFWDMSKGHWQHINFDVIKQYAELLKQDKALIELAEMLGKMEQIEREFEEITFKNAPIHSAFKMIHAHKSDLIGIHESDDLSSLLPSETAFLSDPILQTVFFKKFAEKKLQTFDYQSTAKVNKEKDPKNKSIKAPKNDKGPFIICVDTSGSMQGMPETVAKTLCFALLKMAIKNNRHCYLISFSTEIETLNLTDLNNSLEKLLKFLAMSFQGGTDATPSVQEALKQLESADYKKADILMISDFVMPNFDETTKQQIQKAKNNDTKFHSLVIGRSQNKYVVTDFDNNWLYNPNNSDSMITLVRNLKNM